MSDVGGADIQADLQDYLNAKGINTLFIKIVENLLIEKPDNPIQFIVKYLQREYPGQCGSAPESSSRGMTNQDYDEDDESSEEEDDDEIADIPDIERKPAALNRRISVSAESSTKVENFCHHFTKKVINKSKAEAAPTGVFALDSLDSATARMMPSEYACKCRRSGPVTPDMSWFVDGGKSPPIDHR
jgi:hypothetical protein